MIFSTYFRKPRKFLVLTSVFLSLFANPIFSTGVLASTYGSGNYNTCGYGSSCPSKSTGNSTNSTAAPTDQILLNDFNDFFTDSGKQLALDAGQVVAFNVITNGVTEQKSIIINTIASDYVDITITLASTNLNVRFFPGDKKQYDVNGDGKADIEITLDRITDGKAYFTFKAVLGASTSKPIDVNQPIATATTVSKGRSWWIGLVASLIFLLLGLLSFIVLYRRRKRRLTQQQRPPIQWQ